MSTLPSAPWVEVSIDFKQLSQYLLVVTGDYSRYPWLNLSTQHLVIMLYLYLTKYSQCLVIKCC